MDPHQSGQRRLNPLLDNIVPSILVDDAELMYPIIEKTVVLQQDDERDVRITGKDSVKNTDANVVVTVEDDEKEPKMGEFWAS